MGKGMQRWLEGLRGLRFSTPVVVIYAIASFVGALIAFGSADQGLPLRSFAALIVTSAAIVILIVLRRFIAGEKDVDVLVFVLISLGVGGARGVIMMVIGVQWELIQQTTALAQIINSGVSAVVWLMLAGLVFAGRERYKRSYRSLLVQGATQLQAASFVDADWDRNPTIVAMRARVSPHISEAQISPTPEALMHTAEVIRAEIEQHLRPLSHRLWFGSFDDYPHVRLPQLVKDSITAFRMPIRIIAATWLIGGFIGGPMLFGVTRGILSTLISTGVLTGLLLIFTSLARRHPSLMWGITYLLIAGTIPLVAADGVLRILGFDSDFTVDNGLALLLPLALIAMMIMGLTISMANADRDAVLSVAQRYAVESAEGFANALEASTYLHNTVQSELTGIAMQLTDAAKSGDPKRSRAAVERAQEIMTRSLTEQFREQRVAAAVRVAAVANAWDGICDVDISLADGVTEDPRGGVAIQALEELIANAVRHSGASQITATLTRAVDGITIVCHINRQWQVSERQGLGTRWMATLSPAGISTTHAGNGTVLRITIA
jgi:hypothetical protein